MKNIGKILVTIQDRIFSNTQLKTIFFLRLAIKSQLLSLMFEALCQPVSSLSQETQLSLLSPLCPSLYSASLLLCSVLKQPLCLCTHFTSAYVADSYSFFKTQPSQTSPGSENALLWVSTMPCLYSCYSLYSVLQYFIYASFLH